MAHFPFQVVIRAVTISAPISFVLDRVMKLKGRSHHGDNCNEIPALIFGIAP